MARVCASYRCWLGVLILAVFLQGCGEKITLPNPGETKPNFGDSTYVEIRPRWEPANGYDFIAPKWVFVGRDKFVYVVDEVKECIFRITRAGLIVDSITGISNPVCACQDAMLYLYIVNGTNVIYRKDIYNDGDVEVFFFGDTMTFLGDTLDDVEFVGIACTDDSSRALFAIDRAHNRIYRIDRTGAITHIVADRGSGGGTVEDANGMVYSSSSIYYVQSGGSFGVHKKSIDPPDFPVLLYFAPHGDSVGYTLDPMGVAVDNEGCIYVADMGNKRVQKFDDAGGFITLVGEGDFEEPVGIGWYDGVVYIADRSLGAVIRYQLSTSVYIPED